MSNVFVIDATYAPLPEFTLFGYQTILPDSTITGTPVVQYPIQQALDYRDNTEFAPTFVNSSTEHVYEFQQGTIGKADYFGILSRNGGTAGLRVKVEVFDMDEQQYVEVLDMSTFKNGKPELVYFGHLASGGAFSTMNQRITIQSTERVYITAMYCGKGLLFLHPPSLGFTPAHTSPMDIVENFVTEGNNFTIGRRIPKGFQTKGVINFIEWDFIDTHWPPFQQHVLNSRPLFFAWSDRKPKQVIYGLQNPQTLSKPTYATSFHGSLDFEINGYA